MTTIGIERGKLHERFATYRGKRVFVNDHTFSVDGRLSNWVRFVYLGPRRSGGDYDKGQFSDVCQAVKRVTDPLTKRSLL